MSETPRTDETWECLGDGGESTFPIMLIAEMLERIAIALEVEDD